MWTFGKTCTAGLLQQVSITLGRVCEQLRESNVFHKNSLKASLHGPFPSMDNFSPRADIIKDE